MARFGSKFDSNIKNMLNLKKIIIMKNLKKLLPAILLLASMSAYCQDLKLAVNEDFNDNTLNWDIDDDSQFSSKITDGMYVLTNNAQVYLSWGVSFQYDITKDFVIETKVSIIGGEDEITFFSNYNKDKTKIYGINMDVENAYPCHYYNRQWANSDTYLQSLINGYVKNDEDFVLKVECKTTTSEQSKLKTITYYINDNVIGTDTNVELDETMNRIGFSLSPKTKIEIDYIKVYGTELEKETLSEMQVATYPLSTTLTSTDKVVTIKAGEAIYSMVYLKKSLSEIFGYGYLANIMEVVRIDGETIGIYDWTPSSETVRGLGNRYDIPIAPQIADLKYPQEAYKLTKKLNELEPGVHEITLALVYQFVGMSSGGTLGEITFIFDNTDEAGRKKFNGMVEAYKTKALDNVKLPEAKMTNSTIEASVQQAIIDADWSQTVQKVVIMSNDWTVTHTEYTGEIMYRWINVAVVTKNSLGQCQVFYPIVFQDYLGGGTYTTTITIGAMHKIEHEINCTNVY